MCVLEVSILWGKYNIKKTVFPTFRANITFETYENTKKKKS